MTNEKRKSPKDILNAVWKVFYSMKMGIVLLLIVCVFCLIGSIVIQGNSPAYYTKVYGDSLGNFILSAGLDNIYKTIPFLVIAALLGLNLILCSINRLPLLLKRYKNEFKLDKRLVGNDAAFTVDLDKETVNEIYEKLNCKINQEEEYEGVSYSYAVKGKIHIFGSWLTHLGILLIMAGVALGSLLLYSDYIIGVKGSSSEVPGTDYILTIEDYEITYKEDFVVDNYTTTVQIGNKQNTLKTENLIIQVNSPVTVHGYTYLQNSTGWAVEAVFRELDTGNEIRREIVYPGSSITDDQDAYTYRIVEVYPDFYKKDDKAMTASPFPNNPVVYMAIYYYGGLYSATMKAVDVPIETDAYTITFENPQLFTVLQVTRDPAVYLVAAGSALILAGLALAFYVSVLEIWSCDLPDGKQRLFIKYKQGQTLINDKIDSIIKESRHEQ